MIFREKIYRPKKTESAIDQVNPYTNMLLTKMLLFEGNLIGKISIPFGVGLVAVAKKEI